MAARSNDSNCADNQTENKLINILCGAFNLENNYTKQEDFDEKIEKCNVRLNEKFVQEVVVPENKLITKNAITGLNNGPFVL